MALRLLPFRQYDEQDVVNLYALGDAPLESTTGDGNGSNGVFVKVSNGDFNQEAIEYGTNAYLGNEAYPHVGAGMYPSNPLTVAATASGEFPIGLTLNQTAKTDENGEKLLYNTTKKEELQAVLPGQTVPVATKGIFTLSAAATGGNPLTLGGGFEAQADGKIGGVDAGSAGSLGVVIGTGSRTSNGGITDQFDGNYFIIKLG